MLAASHDGGAWKKPIRVLVRGVPRSARRGILFPLSFDRREIPRFDRNDIVRGSRSCFGRNDRVKNVFARTAKLALITSCIVLTFTVALLAAGASIGTMPYHALASEAAQKPCGIVTVAAAADLMY